MTVVLARHAETVFNAARIVQPPDTPLSPRGREQAARLARRLAGAGIRGVRSSDLPRALVTAELVATAAGLPVTSDPDLQERSYGLVRGRPYAELTEDIFAPAYVPPGGESWETFHARVDRAWARIVESAADLGLLAVVTHGLVCYSILLRHVAWPDGTAPAMHFGNASVTVLDGPSPWRARLVDCTAHLADGRPSDGGLA